ncbi:hypothetical protein, partial [Komagataeibacter rhaeticus]|uniref:hypothetical protein n=1 Tax=Komagataeibacter rhaeticus TaxID=215221 RepID=UPI001CD65991
AIHSSWNLNSTFPNLMATSSLTRGLAKPATDCLPTPREQDDDTLRRDLFSVRLMTCREHVKVMRRTRSKATSAHDWGPSNWRHFPRR